jgi:type II secretory pathway component PulF
MPTFTYQARTVAGELQAGEADFQSRDEVVGFLRRQRLVPVKIDQKQAGLNITIGNPISTRDIVIFTRQFATMINSGLPLVQSLDILARQSENKALRKVIEQVLYDVESGQTLADAMRKHDKVFTDLYVNMVAAGEAGGILDTILLRLAVFLEKADALRRKIKGAMIYPGVILTVAVGAVAVLLVFVIPTFQTMFESAGIELHASDFGSFMCLLMGAHTDTPLGRPVGHFLDVLTQQRLMDDQAGCLQTRTIIHDRTLLSYGCTGHFFPLKSIQRLSSSLRCTPCRTSTRIPTGST